MTTEIMVALIGLAAATFAGQGFWDWLKTKRGKLSPAEKLSMAMGRDRLIFLAKKYIKQGFIPEDEYDMFINMGEAYLEMGGNHYGEKKFNEAKELPTKDDSGL